MTGRASRLLSIILASVLLATTGGPAQAHDSTSYTRVVTFQLPYGNTPAALNFDPNPHMTGRARLDRSREGATLSVKTSELHAGDAYTVWWVIFNNPKECGYDGCSDADFGNPAVEASVLNATGRVADSYGKAQFHSFLPTGFIHTNPAPTEGSPPFGNIRQIFGPGLQNALTAEIHIVIKCHGPAITGPFPWSNVEQLSTFLGDCYADTDDPTGCYDPQVAVFPLPRNRGYHRDKY